MYGKTSPSSPIHRGTYDRYGFPYGQSIEWATPRLANNNKTRAVSDAGQGPATRNLMLDKSFSEPSSPQLKTKGGSTNTRHSSRSKAEHHVQPHPKHSKPVKPVSSSVSLEEINSRNLSQKSSDGSDLSEMLGTQQEMQLRHMNSAGSSSPIRKWSSYSGLSNDGREGYREEETGQKMEQGIPKVYQRSVESLDQMYRASPSHAIHQYGGSTVPSSHMGTQGNLYEKSYPNLPSSTSVAYVTPLRQDTNSSDDYGTPKSSRSRTPSSTNSTDDGDKWDSLLKAKDDLISQKDQIIDRQKKTIAQLQHQQLSMDAKLQHLMLVKSCDQDSVVTLKLQEYQYETAQLRAQLSQMVNEKDAELDRLQRKLGETEYLLDKMDACVKDTAAVKDKNVDSLHYKMSEKDKCISELQTKLDVSKQEHLNVRRRMESLERYLSDVPTTEEHQNTLKTLKEVREECSQLKDIITNKDRKLAQINKAYSSKSEDAKKFHKENKILKENVSSLETHLEKYKKNGSVSEIEFDDIKMENERLEVELNRMKKVMEAKHKKMKALHAQTQKSQKGFEERLTQEEDTVNALRDEVSLKENGIRQMRKSLKELAAQHQDMMEQNLTLKSTCSKYQKARAEETEKAEISRTLWRELSKCVSDLKAIVQLCTARKNGEDPNMSLLLGLRGPSLGGDEYENLNDDLSGLKSKIRKIQETQKEIDTLRTFVSDQYAEDVGNNCVTQ